MDERAVSDPLCASIALQLQLESALNEVEVLRQEVESYSKQVASKHSAVCILRQELRASVMQREEQQLRNHKLQNDLTKVSEAKYEIPCELRISLSFFLVLFLTPFSSILASLLLCRSLSDRARLHFLTWRRKAPLSVTCALRLSIRRSAAFATASCACLVLFVSFWLLDSFFPLLSPAIFLSAYQCLISDNLGKLRETPLEAWSFNYWILCMLKKDLESGIQCGYFLCMLFISLSSLISFLLLLPSLSSFIPSLSTYPARSCRRSTGFSLNWNTHRTT